MIQETPNNIYCKNWCSHKTLLLPPTGFPGSLLQDPSLLPSLASLLHLQPSLLAEANQLLTQTGSSLQSSLKPVYVGVLVLGPLGSRDADFYLRAAGRFRAEYGNVVFMAVTDSAAWTAQHLVGGVGDMRLAVVMEGGGRVGEGLAVLSVCNHTVIR